MVESLKSLVGHIKDVVTNLSQAQETFNTLISKGHETSRVVINDTSSIFDGALEQASHVESTSRTVNEMAELADEVATKVTNTANASQKVNSMVHRGANTATSAIEKMETIFKGIEKTESAAKRLEEKLNDIPKILDVITHISRQTDLLALNATIEASKAGEHGRGFALVAEEVRRFAVNTSKSVEDVDRIVKDLKIEVEGVVSSAGEGTSFLREGRDDIRKIRDILGDITGYTSEVAEKSSLILGLTQKQKDMVGRSVETIGEVAKIAQENLSATEGVEKAVEKHGNAIEDTLNASQKLSELSEELKTVVSRFKVG
jgi:methyl-accepting chemotaxis protein